MDLAQPFLRPSKPRAATPSLQPAAAAAPSLLSTSGGEGVGVGGGSQAGSSTAMAMQVLHNVLMMQQEADA